MVCRTEILHSVEEYLRYYPNESTQIAGLLEMVRTEIDPISRKSFGGHITCGAVVLNKKGKVLKIHHRVLGAWLLPGGHIEPTDESLADAAKREVEEETGIPAGQLNADRAIWPYAPIDIDCHLIPPNPAKNEPAHHHWDFRFVFFVENPMMKGQVEEVTKVCWMSYRTLNKKLRAKTRKLVLRKENRLGIPVPS